MIRVLDELPVILTQESELLDIMAKQADRPYVPGQIILLPQDAILVILPKNEKET